MIIRKRRVPALHTRQLIVRLPEYLMQRLDALSEQRVQSRSEVVRSLLGQATIQTQKGQ